MRSFTWFIPYQAIGDWYGLANALVHPALQEQWGLVLNEACAARLPILSSCTVGASYELVCDGKNGLLFTPENTEDITRSLLTIHQIDSNSRNRMGEVSQNIVADYSPKNFAEGIFQAIASIKTYTLMN